METKVLNTLEINKAVDILKSGGIVAIPTETVYGLAANALDGNAVSKIFKAKGRPMDNPLIVHIADMGAINILCSNFPDKARKLTEKFWPGPLTIILPKSNIIPGEVSAGLDTVAVRFPSHKITQDIIKESGLFLAAPSANKSGSPSPTSALHVFKDLNGKIDAIVDGGECEVGLESTVITFANDKPKLLRPGKVTINEIENVIGKIDIDDSVYNKLKENVIPSSPGMKYKHYAPSAKIILINSDSEKYIDYVNNHKDSGVVALCYDEDIDNLNVPCISYGKLDDSKEQASKIFSCLRKIDDLNAKVAYARCPKKDGVGLAVYNRLIRAAGFEVINIE